jgi:hypothetical protein
MLAGFFAVKVSYRMPPLALVLDAPAGVLKSPSLIPLKKNMAATIASISTKAPTEASAQLIPRYAFAVSSRTIRSSPSTFITSFDMRIVSFENQKGGVSI